MPETRGMRAKIGNQPVSLVGAWPLEVGQVVRVENVPHVVTAFDSGKPGSGRGPSAELMGFSGNKVQCTGISMQPPVRSVLDSILRDRRRTLGIPG